MVYNFSTFRRGNPPLYDGTRFVIDTHGGILHTLRIIYYERINHFQPILNLVGATGTRRYCIPCNKKYWHVEDHRCSNKCYKCLTIPQCDLSENLKQCTLCFRSFFGDLYYENHLKKGSFNSVSSVCRRMKICQICCKTVRLNDKR